MLYHTTWLISKLDPLKYMMESTALNGRMARSQILLSEFDIIYVSQKAVKGSAIADFLASRALEENQMADALATLASMIKVNKQENIKPIQMSIYEAPAHCYNVEEEERDGHPWYQDILRYVRNREYPKHATENDKRTLRRLACDYVLDGEILYKRRKDQIYGDKIHVPHSPLHVITFPWPFSMWGMDVIGPISPKASNRHRFIFIVIDYLTKWAEAASYANVTKSAVSRFLKKEIICRYGLPERIISDNVLNLNNSTTAEVCSQFKIRHHNSTPYHPKMNGAVGVANKNIKKIVGKMAETYKDWHEKLPFTLYAYRTSMYQKRMMRAYDKKVRPREFSEGDLVLKNILPMQKDFRGKWMPNWEGPYMVKKAFSGGALILSEMDGKNLPNPINLDSVKKYYT
ncbi:RNA-directed DNA polymerase [Gossypium australe]|uniref:RNA-directed DNA polymerase n=1 Tax=Gossypium australe TaxID=47621 RepID=A0A5B6VNQ9_9ROSI|nr:RNA-directed DNA polymerase [Gossypium australe]